MRRFASASAPNQWAFRHSARKVPLNDSTKALSVGLPGREKSSMIISRAFFISWSRASTLFQMEEKSTVTKWSSTAQWLNCSQLEQCAIAFLIVRIHACAR
jgi:hypothetical protein